MSKVDDARAQVKAWNPEDLRVAGLIPADRSYYPSIYYPPIPMYGKCDETTILNGLRYDPSRPSSVYIHIPFCRSRCRYCHWVTYPGSADAVIDDHLDHLAREVALWKRKFGADRIRPHSVLYGGGTPTAISPKQTEKLCRALAAEIDFSGCEQSTLEVEPGTILGEAGMEKLRVWLDHGVERISIGVQAFNDRAVEAMGRAHSTEDSIRSIEQARKAGMRSISVDLIYGYPGSTPENWLSTLEMAVSLDIDAFQLYRLRIVPHGDRVGEVKPRFDKEPEVFPSVDDVYVMKQLGFLIAGERGMNESTRRVFTRGEHHASQYLRDHCDRLTDVIGFGTSSWSTVQGRFYLNAGGSLDNYAGYIDNGKLPIDRGKVRTRDDELRWAVVLALKHNGVSKSMFSDLTGISVAEAFPRQVANLKKYGLIRETLHSYKLTDRGKFFADEVVIQFYHPTYMPFPRSKYTDGELNPHLYTNP